MTRFRRILTRIVAFFTRKAVTLAQDTERAVDAADLAKRRKKRVGR